MNRERERERERERYTPYHSFLYSVSCLFTNAPHLEVKHQPQLLAPGDTTRVKFLFQPHKAIKYCEEVEFEINGICRKAVTIRGEGALMKVSG